MKKQHYLLSILALFLLLASPAISHGQETNTQGDVRVQGDDNNISGETNAQTNVPPGMPPREGSIGAQIRYDNQVRLNNMRNNQGLRNNMLQGQMPRMQGSTTRPWMGTSTRPWPGRPVNRLDEDGTSTMPRDFRGMPMMRNGDEQGDENGPRMMGSTSMMRFDRDGYDQARKAMMFDMFKIRKALVTKQLHVALTNLNNIRTRINSRIQKEQSAGKDMAKAIALLATADAKIKIASDAVAALDAYTPSAQASSTASTSVAINLDAARQLADTAQKDIHEAQRSLNDVVRAIAHAMGVNLEEQATTSTSTQN